MATDGPAPKHCNTDTFATRDDICVVDATTIAVKRWVQILSEKADAKVDWRHNGARISVLHIGDADSRQRVLDAIRDLESELDGIILNIGGPTLYRAGNEVPEGTIAIDPDLGPIVASE